MEDRQSRGGCRFPVVLRIVAYVQNLVGRKIDNSQRTPENLWIGFVCANFAGKKNLRKEFRDAELLENETQSSIKIGNDRQLKARTQFLQNIDNFRVKLPHARLGEMLVGDLEKIVAVEFAERRRHLIEDKIDKCAPPIFVVIF